MISRGRPNEISSENMISHGKPNEISIVYLHILFNKLDFEIIIITQYDFTWQAARNKV